MCNNHDAHPRLSMIENLEEKDYNRLRTNNKWDPHLPSICPIVGAFFSSMLKESKGAMCWCLFGAQAGAQNRQRCKWRSVGLTSKWKRGKHWQMGSSCWQISLTSACVGVPSNCGKQECELTIHWCRFGDALATWSFSWRVLLTLHGQADNIYLLFDSVRSLHWITIWDKMLGLHKVPEILLPISLRFAGYHDTTCFYAPQGETPRWKGRVERLHFLIS